MMRNSLVLGLLVGFFCARPALADVMVLPVEGTNLEENEEDAIWQLIASAYQAERRETVLPRERARAAVEETGGYSEAAQKLGAPEYAYGSAVRLNEKIVVSATLYSSDGKLLHSAKMTADGLDDMELTAERLARALARRQSPKETRDIDTVTKTEARRPNRTWIEKVNGFKIGLIYPYGYDDEDIAPMLNAGFDARVESRNYFLEFGVGVTIPTTDDRYELAYGGVYAEVGASWYLAHSSVSPYLGLGAMPRLASRSIANLVLYGQGGLMFFRESSSRLYTDIRIGQNVLPVGFGSLIDSEDYQKLYPTEFTLQIGVGF